MSLFHLRILAADKVFYDGECSSVTLPLPDGQYGVLAHHQPMAAAIVPGVLVFRTENETVRMAAVASGMVKVSRSEVLVLVETAEDPDTIDEEEARREAEEAEETLHHKLSGQDHDLAQARLMRSLNRLRAKQTLSGK